MLILLMRALTRRYRVTVLTRPQVQSVNLLSRYFNATLAKELFQRWIHILFVVNPHSDKTIFVLQTIGKDRKQRP